MLFKKVLFLVLPSSSLNFLIATLLISKNFTDKRQGQKRHEVSEFQIMATRTEKKKLFHFFSRLKETNPFRFFTLIAVEK